MMWDKLMPRECLDVLERSDRKRFTHHLSGGTVWQFGTLNREADRIEGLTATDPGNYAAQVDLGKGVAVAQSEDGNLLICNSDAKVAVLDHEDSFVRLLGISISKWLDEASSYDAGVFSDCGLPPRWILSRWHPVRSPHLGQGVVDCLPDIEVRADGKWSEHWTWPVESLDEFEYCFSQRTIDQVKVNHGGDLIRYGFARHDKDQLVLTGPDCDHDVFYDRVTP